MSVILALGRERQEWWHLVSTSLTESVDSRFSERCCLKIIRQGRLLRKAINNGLWVHVHVHLYIYICTHIYTFAHTHIYTHTHTHLHTYSHIHTHAHTYTSIHTIYTYTHIHTYIYTCTHMCTDTWSLQKVQAFAMGTNVCESEQDYKMISHWSEKWEILYF